MSLRIPERYVAVEDMGLLCGKPIGVGFIEINQNYCVTEHYHGESIGKRVNNKIYKNKQGRPYILKTSCKIYLDTLLYNK